MIAHAGFLTQPHVFMLLVESKTTTELCENYVQPMSHRYKNEVWPFFQIFTYLVISQNAPILYNNIAPTFIEVR